MGINANSVTASTAAPSQSAFSSSGRGVLGSLAGDDPNGTGKSPSQFGSADSASQGASVSAQGSGGGNPGATPDGSGTSAAATPQGNGTASQAATSQSTSRGTQGPRQPRNAVASGTAAGTQSAQTTPGSANDPGTDFGNVMAIALGRSTADTTEPTKSTAATPDDTTATKPPSKSTTSASPDPSAWLAQFMSSNPASQPLPTQSSLTPAAADNIAGAAGSDTGAVSALLAGASAAGTAQPGTAADTTGNAAADAASADPAAGAPGAQSSAVIDRVALTPLVAPGARVATTPLPPSRPPGSGTDAAAPANSLAAGATAVAADITAMANTHKLFTGLSAASTDTNSDDTATATPGVRASSTDSGFDGTQALAALQVAPLTHPAAGDTSISIQAPVGSAAFADELSSRIAGMVQSGISTTGITQAQLQLNPANLGPVQVHISMQAGQASVWFGASHADTRTALEQSLPQLREMFANAGMPLADSGVFREPPRQQQAPAAPTSGQTSVTSSDAAPVAVTQVSRMQLSLLDTYA